MLKPLLTLILIVQLIAFVSLVNAQNSTPENKHSLTFGLSYSNQTTLFEVTTTKFDYQTSSGLGSIDEDGHVDILIDLYDGAYEFAEEHNLFDLDLDEYPKLPFKTADFCAFARYEQPIANRIFIPVQIEVGISKPDFDKIHLRLVDEKIEESGTTGFVKEKFFMFKVKPSAGIGARVWKGLSAEAYLVADIYHWKYKFESEYNHANPNWEDTTSRLTAKRTGLAKLALGARLSYCWEKYYAAIGLAEMGVNISLGYRL